MFTSNAFAAVSGSLPAGFMQWFVGLMILAVIVGTPDFSRPVPVRIHSACLTGDVFGSRRCDCGDQLQLALTRLVELLDVAAPSEPA